MVYTPYWSRTTRSATSEGSSPPSPADNEPRAFALHLLRRARVREPPAHHLLAHAEVLCHSFDGHPLSRRVHCRGERAECPESIRRWTCVCGRAWMPAHGGYLVWRVRRCWSRRMVGGVEDIFTTVCAVVRTRTVAGGKPVHDICGTAFALSRGLFMTAAHVLDGPKESFSLGTRVGTGPFQFRVWPLLDWELFSGADVALVRCDLPGAVCRSWYPNEVDMLTTVHAFGYPFAVDLHNLRVRARALKGHVVCADDAGAVELPGMPRIYELSFQSPRGLSGAPLLLPTTQGLLVGGVVVANRSTTLRLPTQQETITEH